MLLRDTVLVTSNASDLLRRELESRDLIVSELASVDDALAAVAEPRTRSLIYHASSPLTRPREQRNLLKLLESVAPTAIKCGVAVSVVVTQDDAAQSNWSWLTQQADGSAASMGAVDTKRFRVTVIKELDAGAPLAQACVRHDPERHWIDIDVNDGGARIPDERREELARVHKGTGEDKWLLQRAFSDCTDIEIELLQSRRSGKDARCVYQVWPRRGGSPPIVPFIVKTAPAEAVESELGSARQVCGDRTPFSYFPPIADDRNVTGIKRAALVSHFVERAATLECYIQNHSPAVAIASLFDGPLRCWRSHMRSERLSVGQYLLKAGIVSDRPRSYRGAYAQLESEGQAVLTPKNLLKRLRALPEREVRVCTSHGDLHINNVFVRENSVDIVLIDFNRAGDAPAARDPAELEVSLAFTTPKAGGGVLPTAELALLYECPLLRRPLLPRRSHPRALAIEEVRKQVSAVIEEGEYREMIAGHLLWHASKGNAVAYAIASRLLENV